MKLKKGYQLASGWNIDSCSAYKENYSLYTVKKNSQASEIYSSLFMIPAHDEEQKDTMIELLEFYRELQHQEGVLEIYDWSVQREEQGYLIFVRTEVCQPVASMGFSQSQCCSMGISLLEAIGLFHNCGRPVGDLQADAVMMTDSGSFKLASFAAVNSSKRWVRMQDDFKDLGILLQAMSRQDRKALPSFKEKVKQAVCGQFEEKEAFAAFLKEEQGRKAHHKWIQFKKLTIDVLALFAVVVVAGGLLLMQSLNAAATADEVQLFEKTHEALLDSSRKFQDTKQSPAKKAMIKNGWVPTENGYVKKITGASLFYEPEKMSSRFHISIEDEYISFNELHESLTMIAPEIVLHSFIEHENMNEYLGISSEMKDWLIRTGTRERWQNERGTSYIYKGDSLYISYDLDDAKEHSYFVLSDYENSILVRMLFEKDSPKEFEFHFYEEVQSKEKPAV